MIITPWEMTDTISTYLAESYTPEDHDRILHCAQKLRISQSESIKYYIERHRDFRTTMVCSKYPNIGHECTSVIFTVRRLSAKRSLVIMYPCSACSKQRHSKNSKSSYKYYFTSNRLKRESGDKLPLHQITPSTLPGSSIQSTQSFWQLPKHNTSHLLRIRRSSHSGWAAAPNKPSSSGEASSVEEIKLETPTLVMAWSYNNIPYENAESPVKSPSFDTYYIDSAC